MKLFPLLLFFFFSTFFTFCLAGNVTFDKRSLIINGQRKLLISASIHYPRSVPAMWPGLVQTAKEGGADVIESYVFWNGHELSPGKYYFGGRFDLVKFVKIVQDAGMYMILRIGPFVAAEYNLGGIPVWLHYIPGSFFRTDSEPFKFYMKRFMTVIVDLMKEEKLFASQGGPIILAQVENEYGWYQMNYGEPGNRYASWAMQTAFSQNIGVPWIMCQQYTALPDYVIDTCNSFYCDQFTPTSPNKPKIWTENWPGWFQTFGGKVPHRPVEDIAFSVARFFQKGGSVQNYYMYHGGTNFGRTAGLYISTSYDYDAPIDEYGLPRNPKWGHLKDLHRAIKLCEQVVLDSGPINLSLGPSQEADVYTDSSGACAAFLSNMDNKTDMIVEFRNASYHLPAWSVSILPDCKNVVFNSAKVTSPTSRVEMVSENLQTTKWEIFEEKVGIWGQVDFMQNGLVDHIDTTKFASDYLWYNTSFYVNEDEEFLKKGNLPVLQIESKGHALHVFVNGELKGSPDGANTGPAFKFKKPVPLKAGNNNISLLSMTLGLPSAGLYYEWMGSGLTSVKIDGFSNGTVDFTLSSWNYKIGLEGESLGIYKPNCVNCVKWGSTTEPPKNQPLTWYKTIVDQPSGEDPIALDMLAMGKGLAWLNGEEIGRYWPKESPLDDQCVQECDYRGTFSQWKCSTGCGEPTQRCQLHKIGTIFHGLGSSQLEMFLVIFEEKGGDPTKIKFAKRKISGMCALVGEDYPLATVNLKCPKNSSISEVKFASFGNPEGTCGSYRMGHCHDPTSTSVIEMACLNKNECAIELTDETFDKSPKLKKLSKQQGFEVLFPLISIHFHNSREVRKLK
ncbi:hypothetical protein Patl1_15485 [Pistacia atlantica]|uniref:Uncharacterized protein n=1 Tax=Pistacia atlantica TaxID=434234 RepID=A0ACC1B5I7_9ROSI|nr:hypothetical protein Patl1_15485 [Pistacia atlantica]